MRLHITVLFSMRPQPRSKRERGIIMDKAKYLLGPYNENWFGVLGIPKDHRHAELHGVFKTREAANKERLGLLETFSNYESVKVVRIDLVNG